MIETRRKPMALGIFIIFICAAGLFFSAAARAELVDRIVAVVNNDVIRLSDLEKVLAPYMEKLKAAGYSPEKEREWMFKIREDALNGLIDRKLVDQESDQLKIKVDDKEVDAMIEQIKKESNMTDETLRAALAREGETMDSFRKKRREEMLRARLMDMQVTSRVVITQEEIERIYQENKDHYAGKELYHLRLALIPLSPNASPEETKSAREALVELTDVLAAGKSFDDAAAEAVAKHPEMETSDLGLFEIPELTDEVQKDIAGKKAGEPSSIRRTDQGLRFVFLEEIQRTPDVSLTQAEPEIRRKIYTRIVNEKYDQWLSDLRKRSYVKIIR
ncbi:MAG: SurA N-terminal domain-containing protein [Thermodesulfobacteriota bacterium]